MYEILLSTEKRKLYKILPVSGGIIASVAVAVGLDFSKSLHWLQLLLF